MNLGVKILLTSVLVLIPIMLICISFDLRKTGLTAMLSWFAYAISYGIYEIWK